MKTFKEYIGEMFGPMGGDQRNMRGSIDRVRLDDEFNGKSINFPLDPDYGRIEDYTDNINQKAEEAKVTLEKKVFDVRISGKKTAIKKFLKNLGYKPREYAEYFPK